MRIQQDSIQLGNQRSVDGTQVEMTRLSQSYDQVKAQLLAEVTQQRQTLIDQARQEATDVKRLAENEARQLVADTQAACQSIEETARQAGYADGHQQGREEGLTEAMNNTSGMVTALKEAEARLFYSIKQDLAKLVEGVCQRVTQHQLHTHPEQWVSLIEVAIAQCVDVKQATIVLPEALAQELNSLILHKPQLNNAQSVRLLPDRQLQPGQAFVITDKQSLNLSLDAQIQQLLAAVKPETWVECDSLQSGQNV